MKMSAATPARFVCQLCKFRTRPPTTRALSIFAHASRTPSFLPQETISKPRQKRQKRSYAIPPTARRAVQNTSRKEATSVGTVAASPATLDTDLKWITDATRNITFIEAVPEEIAILEILTKSQEIANILTFGTTQQPQAQSAADTAAMPAAARSSSTSSLLELEDEGEVYGAKAISSSSSKSGVPIATRQRAANIISATIFDLLDDPKVFISPAALNLYTRTQLLLGRPQYLPKIFDLYATKPIPKAKSSPITYSRPWAPHPRNAIDIDLSSAALDAAIAKKDLPLAVAIIDTTVATPAFRLAKTLRKAALPLAAFLALPFVAYTGADWVAHYQDTMDEDRSRFLVMLGSAAYIGSVSVVGFVALTTYNDQMERVTWQPGKRLRDRWLHEEERMYLDRVAMAWGFKEKWRRGEEQGEEWEALREVLALRMMVLDKSSLLDGME